MKNILITIKEETTRDLNDLSSDFSNLGMQIQRVYPYGVISGRADDVLIEQLKQHHDVDRVQIEKRIQLPSPDEDIQ